MAKYYGAIGFSITKKTAPGVWSPEIEEHMYAGDLLRNYKRAQTGTSTNDDISLSNQISILADPFAYNNFQNIQYATYMGAKWCVTSVDVQYPRLILDLGGVYNGPENRSPEDA